MIEGSPKITLTEEYNSNNTKILSVEEIKKKLLALNVVKDELQNWEEDKMKFLVLGATGMAGHTISIYLSEQGHDVTTFSRTPFPYCKNINGDIRMSLC